MSETVCARSHTVQSQNEVDMTEDEIQQLLLEAESRLRVPDLRTTEESKVQSSEMWVWFGSVTNHSEELTMDFSIPKLSSNSSLQPYVHEQGNVVTVDGLRIIDPQQKDASKFDPIGLKNLSSSSKRVSPST